MEDTKCMVCRKQFQRNEVYPYHTFEDTKEWFCIDCNEVICNQFHRFAVRLAKDHLQFKKCRELCGPIWEDRGIIVVYPGCKDKCGREK